MKTLILIFCFSIFTFSAFGQCDLLLKDSPTIRGFRLDMPKDEADQLIPKGIGRITISKNYIMLSSADLLKSKAFEDVLSIEAHFYEDRLNRFEIIYEPTAAKWKSGKEFAKNLSDNLKLPFTFWAFEKADPLYAKMICREFYLDINADVNGILLEDLTVKARIKKAEDDKKNVFKP